MRKGTMTRSEVIAAVGIDLVNKVEAENCEPTNRVGYNGACQGDEETEWMAAISLDDGRSIRAYYYTSNEDDEAMAANSGDGSSIDWTINGYEID